MRSRLVVFALLPWWAALIVAVLALAVAVVVVEGWLIVCGAVLVARAARWAYHRRHP